VAVDAELAARASTPFGGSGGPITGPIDADELKARARRQGA
jgi:hypothetical protein